MVLALGIDPGTLNLGWGLVERDGNRLRHVAHGVIRLKPGAPLPQRLAVIDESLSDVIAHHHPGVGSVESLFFHKDPQAAAKLGHARGVVLLCFARANLEVFEYPPARVKRTLVGHGQADKRQMALMVRAVLGLPEPPASDAADALALAITHLRVGTLVRALEEAAPSANSPRQRLLAALGQKRRVRRA